jgi:hypothetical protein
VTKKKIKMILHLYIIFKILKKARIKEIVEGWEIDHWESEDAQN